MESSSLNTQMNKTTFVAVEHDQREITLANLSGNSSEKIPTPSSTSNNGNNDDHGHNNSTSSTGSLPSHISNTTLVPETPLPKPPPSDSSPILQPPPNQEMNHSPSGYRIPSSVFERSTSSTPMDWSIASNESLFSIHTGNMSFTNDHYLWRSGELGPLTESSTSDHIFSYSADKSSSGVVDDMRSRELGIAEATMLEVIKESEVQNKTSLAEVRKARRSDGSNTSNKSFAFSIMGGDIGSSKMRASEVRSNQEQAQPEATMQPPESQPDRTTPTDTKNGAQSSWLSCFPCCSSRLETQGRRNSLSQ